MWGEGMGDVGWSATIPGEEPMGGHDQRVPRRAEPSLRGWGLIILPCIFCKRRPLAQEWVRGRVGFSAI